MAYALCRRAIGTYEAGGVVACIESRHRSVSWFCRMWKCGFVGSMDDLIVSGLRIDWSMLADSYASRIPSLRSLDELGFRKNVTFLVGENGSGKSTLLEAIAVVCGFNAEGGTRNYRFSTYDDTSDLAEAMTVYRQRAIGPSSFFLRAESFFTLATQAREYGRGYDNMSRLHEMSHGEGFLEILLSRTGRGLYLMDEPESALSPQRQLTLPPIHRSCSACRMRESCHSTKPASIPAIMRIRTAIESPRPSSIVANRCFVICLEMNRETAGNGCGCSL